MKLLLMADAHVGSEILHWLLDVFPQDLAVVITTGKNEIYCTASEAGISPVVVHSSQQVVNEIRHMEIEPDLGILAWWPKIIREPLLSLPHKGFINTHPSLLPHNRGKHYNFWALVEQAPFGVSLHFVDEGVDCGDIVAQHEIHYDWEDNGASLYVKAQQEIVALFKETYPRIRTLDIPRIRQGLDKGSFHIANEINDASFIDLDKMYRARDLLNLLRARTFPEHPACWFRSDNDTYEVRISIKRKKT